MLVSFIVELSSTMHEIRVFLRQFISVFLEILKYTKKYICGYVIFCTFAWHVFLWEKIQVRRKRNAKTWVQNRVKN